VTPGDLILFRTPRSWKLWQCWDTWLVWAGQRIRVALHRFMPKEQWAAIPHAHLVALCAVTHSAVVVTPLTLMQADAKGVHEDAIWFDPARDFLIDTGDTPEDRAQVVARGRRLVKHTYAFVRFGFLAISYLTGMAFSIGMDGWRFCSGLSADQLSKGAFDAPRDIQNMAPLDLAAYPAYYAQIRDRL
jgi:hypothetical protein